MCSSKVTFICTSAEASVSPLLQIVLIFVLGTLCQIAAWRVSLPSILLLLIAGLACGPVLELLKPDQVFGLTLNPLIELAVAVILFEGGLSLRKAEMGKVGFIVLRLISAAAIATWILLGIASYALLNINFQTASLLGAILVVSGPTVVLPLLRIIRAKSPLEQILRWEGILIDPIGVILAVLIADACELGLGYSAPGHVFFGILVGLGVGLFLGWLGAAVLAWTVGRHTVPDHFVVPLTLTVLFSLVIASYLLHEQSGLLTATVMGLTVARYHQAWVQTIEGFIGHTQRMFIGVLFIILAARLDIDYLAHLDLNLCFF
ncbi:MAG: hypothetical protein DCC75_12535, partial [Proteobacteria bacterium]